MNQRLVGFASVIALSFACLPGADPRLDGGTVGGGTVGGGAVGGGSGVGSCAGLIGFCGAIRPRDCCFFCFGWLAGFACALSSTASSLGKGGLSAAFCEQFAVIATARAARDLAGENLRRKIISCPNQQ
jgi:hypothetical protein